MANLAAVGLLSGTGTWLSGDVLTNPNDGTILVDTGPLPGSSYLFGLVASTTVALVLDVQYRDATNTTTLHVQRRRIAANSNEDFYLPNKLKLAADERVRAVLVGSVTGEVQVSLFVVEVG